MGKKPHLSVRGRLRMLWAMQSLLKIWTVCLLVGAAEAAPAPAPAAEKEAAGEAKTEADGRTGWFAAPIVAYAPETGAAFGAAVIRYFTLPGGRDSVARLDARYTTRKQVIVRARNRVYWNDNFVRTWLSYERFPDAYYGIGGDTPNESEAYTPIEWRGEVDYERRIWRRLFVGGGYELTHVALRDVAPGGLVETDPALVGRNGGWQSGLGVQLTWDSRDNVNATREGTFARARVTAFDGALGSTYDYRRTTLDVRQFFPLPREHVFAVRGLARSSQGDTPFYDLSMLGGRMLMRGVFEGRYRDNHMLAFQAEYRMPIWWRLGLAAFAATGQVGDTLGELNFRHSHLSGGAGIRCAISKPSRLNARVDVGASSEGAKIYLTFNEAF